MCIISRLTVVVTNYYLRLYKELYIRFGLIDDELNCFPSFHLETAGSASFVSERDGWDRSYDCSRYVHVCNRPLRVAT